MTFCFIRATLACCADATWCACNNSGLLTNVSFTAGSSVPLFHSVNLKVGTVLIFGVFLNTINSVFNSCSRPPMKSSTKAEMSFWANAVVSDNAVRKAILVDCMVVEMCCFCGLYGGH